MKDIKKMKQIHIFVAAFISCLLFYGIVFWTGGTIYPFPHLFYLTIVFASFYGNWFITLFTAGFASILMSYWLMPIQIEDYMLQDHFSWLFRTMMFLFVAVITKLSADFIRNQRRIAMENSEQIIAFQKATFNGILNLAEARDPETTGQHLERLSYFAKILLENIPIPSAEKTHIISTIAFHDIGKIAIPDEILQKPGKLTDLEFEVIKDHAVIGGELLRRIEESLTDEDDLHEMIKTARELTYFHHERPDGKGYPLGLKGDEIPFAAKVTALCDVYDALTSKRPYKGPIPHDQCVKIIQQGRGTQFDAEIVDQFMAVHCKFKEIAETFKDGSILLEKNIFLHTDEIIKNKKMKKVNKTSCI
ncbi:HD domain-containing phosphohydrolase [Clostridiaceae bacterium 35-E11]